MDEFIGRMLKQEARGIRTRQEVVDGALGFLAYNEQFELVESVLHLLWERFPGEVKRWIEYVEAPDQLMGMHWVPYYDSRLIGQFHGEVAGGKYTQEQREHFTKQMRINVAKIACEVRRLLEILHSIT
jgi:hypothetical protein